MQFLFRNGLRGVDLISNKMLFLYLGIIFMRYHKFLIVFLLTIACNQKHAGRPASTRDIIVDTSNPDDVIYQTDAVDAEMNAAIDSARQTLYVFDIALRRNDNSLRGFTIKKRYKTPEGNGEHIWIVDIKPFKQGYKGIVNNVPVQTKEISYGDSVYIDKKDITDWFYIQDDLLRGGFTIKVELRHMTPAERARTLEGADYKIEY